MPSFIDANNLQPFIDEELRKKVRILGTSAKTARTGQLLITKKKQLNQLAGNFATNAYDLVAMITVDCFLDDILKAFSEVRRILESNGYFIIAFIDKDTDLGQLYDEKKKSNIFYR